VGMFVCLLRPSHVPASAGEHPSETPSTAATEAVPV
jgi:hypothetical protein